MNPNNFWVIAIDGTDCCGKTTLIKELNKVLDYNCWLIDRSTISVRTYSAKFGRNLSNPCPFERLISSYDYFLYVRLTADKEDIIKRQNKKNDGYDVKDFEKDTMLFDNAENISCFNQGKMITLNSSTQTIEEEINEILSIIKLKEEE